MFQTFGSNNTHRAKCPLCYREYNTKLIQECPICKWGEPKKDSPQLKEISYEKASLQVNG